MVAAVRAGTSRRAVARQYRVSLLTVQRWVRRAGHGRLDRVNWADRPPVPRTIHRTAPAIEERVLALRQELQTTSALGEYGARAIHREWLARAGARPPAVRTIGRILERRGALDGRRRVRWPAPPPGWYLPDVAAGRVELESFDIVEGLVIEGGIEVEVLNAIALHAGLVGSWPGPAVTTDTILAAVVPHWQAAGLPAYAQFDNDTRFQGPHQFPDAIGRVTRCCCSLGVVPVFVPPREPGFQGAIEAFNGRWQAAVWERFHHASLAALQAQAVRYVAAHRGRTAVRREAAPPRRPFPAAWTLELEAPVCGRIIYLRRTSEHGTVSLLGHTFAVNPLWPHRLVRCELDLDAGCLRFFALRRRDPTSQPLLREVPYVLPATRIQG